MSKANDKQPEFVTMRGPLTIQAAAGDARCRSSAWWPTPAA